MRFKIAPEKEEWTRSYLTERETGYDAVMTSFYPVHKDMSQAGEATELQVFIADQSMDYYLGEAGDRDIAWQIYHAKVCPLLIGSLLYECPVLQRHICVLTES